MRLLFVLVISLLLFFFGVTVGMIGKQQTIDEREIEAIIEQHIERTDENIAIIEETEMLPPIVEEDKYIHSLASFLETIVTSLYDVLIFLLYKIAAFFFD